MNGDAAEAYRSILRHLALGVAVVLFVTVGVGGWAMTTEIAGAVVTQGVLVVESSAKKVQHPTGGTVGELRVREGDHVNAGDIVVRLDDTQTRAAAAIVSKSLNDLAARKARLEAERDNADHMTVPDPLLPGSEDAAQESTRAFAAEQKLFDLRRSAREGQKSQLRERLAQLDQEIRGYEGQATAKRREIELVNQELEGVSDLWHKNLVPISKLTELERDAARLEGEHSQLMGSVAQAKAKMTETELQIIQIDQNLRSDVGKDLTETNSKIAELVEKKVSAEDQLRRVDIRAPQSGIVHELNVHTVGGVISAAEPIMMIVPDADALTVEAKVAAQDISQLHLGQMAALRFSSFNQRTTPEIDGAVSLIPADLTEDKRTGQSYYVVRVSPKTGAIGGLGAVKLVPGMPVDVFIKTDDRTVMSYLTKPLADQVARAFKEK